MRKYAAVCCLGPALLALGLAVMLYHLPGLEQRADWRLWPVAGLLLCGLLSGAASGALLAPRWRRAGLLAGASLGLPLSLLLWTVAPNVLTWPVLLAPLPLSLLSSVPAALLGAAIATVRQIYKEKT